jgi:hypothetical protein
MLPIGSQNIRIDFVYECACAGEFKKLEFVEFETLKLASVLSNQIDDNYLFYVAICADFETHQVTKCTSQTVIFMFSLHKYKYFTSQL